jgi:hypothetical protein
MHTCLNPLKEVADSMISVTLYLANAVRTEGEYALILLSSYFIMPKKGYVDTILIEIL